MQKRIIILSLLLFFLIQGTDVSYGQSESGGRKIEKIILDAGHGGKDPGTISLSGDYEKNIVLPIVLKIRDLLESGYDDLKVVLTRDRDEFIELKDRGMIANQYEGNLFISIHCNAKKNEENDKKGFEIYLLDIVRIPEAIKITLQENKIFNFLRIFPDTTVQKVILTSLLQNSFFRYSEKFSSIAEYELSTETKLESRGIMEAGYYVLLGASMPSVLIECGYLSNKEDEEYLKSETGKNEIAKSIYKAIRLFKLEYDFENRDF
jgi:N-acetylmuramoyl-L-alanine amidase